MFNNYIMPEITFNLSEDFIPLSSLLKALNIVSSGGQAKIMIDDGMVQVNGVTEYQKRKKIRKGDTVLISNEKIWIV